MRTFEIISNENEILILEGRIDLQERKAQRKHKTTTLEDYQNSGLDRSACGLFFFLDNSGDGSSKSHLSTFQKKTNVNNGFQYDQDSHLLAGYKKNR